MESFLTKYGTITSVSNYSLYKNGNLKDCVLSEENIIKTKYGDLIPQYDFIDVRRKNINSLTFFSDGRLEHISLNNQTPIKTSIGIIDCELITFFNSGNINRLFQLNGQVSAYWDEEQEYSLSKDINFSFNFGSFSTKPTGIYFYESGQVKGLSLWPNERIKINTPNGIQDARLGISLYENGNLKSFEPSTPLVISTPIGEIIAFDSNNYTFFKEIKSINFSEDGIIKSILTSKNVIRVTDSNNITHIYEPKAYDDFGDGFFYIYPLKISFNGDKIYFDDYDTFIISQCNFAIDELTLVENAENCTSDCSTCNSNCSSNYGSISIV